MGTTRKRASARNVKKREEAQVALVEEVLGGSIAPENATADHFRPIKSIQEEAALIERARAISAQLLNSHVQTGDVEGVLDVSAMESILTLRQLRDFGSTDKIRFESAKELAHMAGYRPVERRMTINKNIDGMKARQLDQLILSTISRDDKLKELVSGEDSDRHTDAIGGDDGRGEAEAGEVIDEASAGKGS